MTKPNPTEDMTSVCCTANREAIAAMPSHKSALLEQAALEQASLEQTAGTKGADITDDVLYDDCAEIPAGLAYLGTDAPFLPVDEEGPLRRQKIKRFWMDKYAVTVARFALFVKQTNYLTDAEKYGDSFVFHAHLPKDSYPDRIVVAAPWWRSVPGACWHNPTGPDFPTTPALNHPVTHISWQDAMAFAKWAKGRLPSEAEWEHAARGGLGDVKYPWGDEDPPTTIVQAEGQDATNWKCNIWQGQFPDHNSADDGYFGTAPVDAFAPNGYGLYNMCGNVWEWTAQNFKVQSLKKQIKQAHLGKQGYKLTKGGSFLCHISYCYRYRIAARTSNSPESTTSHQGFRLVYDQDPQRLS